MSKIELTFCPNCKNILQRTETVIRCDGCSKEVKVHDKIYDFLGDKGYYWGEIPVDEANHILDFARKHTWRMAAMHISTKYPSLGKSILSSSRTDWVFHCLDMNNARSCLDIGSGWGANTFALSKHFDQVWSLEAVKQRIEFQKIRSLQEKSNNINFLRSDWLNLPFSDESFDLVVLNGALEWVGLSDYSKSPRELQLKLLKEIKRVLKPSGCLYIGIENRYGIQFFLGGRDHSGMKFTSLLPRKIADIIVRKFRKTGGDYDIDKRIKEDWQDYRTFTYSKYGYEKLLSDAGYKNTEIYWTNSYNFPRFAGKLDGESIAVFLNWFSRYIPTKYQKLRNRISNIYVRHLPDILKEYIVRMFSPNFLIFAYNSVPNVSFEKQILQEFKDATSFIRISGSHSNRGKVSYLLTKNKKPYKFCKFARFEEHIDDLAQEEHLIERFNKCKLGKFAVGPKTVFVEEMINGNSCKPYDTNQNLLAIDWLLNFQQETQNGFCDIDYFNTFLDEQENVYDLLDLDRSYRLLLSQQLKDFVRLTQKTPVQACAEHGDFSLNNILIGKQKKICVIDWECYKESGDCLFDFVFFLICSMVRNPGRNVFDSLKGEGKYAQVLKVLLNEYSNRKSLPLDLILSSIPYILFRCIYRVCLGEKGQHINVAYFCRLLQMWSSFSKEISNKQLINRITKM